MLLKNNLSRHVPTQSNRRIKSKSTRLISIAALMASAKDFSLGNLLSRKTMRNTAFRKSIFRAIYSTLKKMWLLHLSFCFLGGNLISTSSIESSAPLANWGGCEGSVSSRRKRPAVGNLKLSMSASFIFVVDFTQKGSKAVGIKEPPETQSI